MTVLSKVRRQLRHDFEETGLRCDCIERALPLDEQGLVRRSLPKMSQRGAIGIGRIFVSQVRVNIVRQPDCECRSYAIEKVQLMVKVFKYDDLASADLLVDAVYEGKNSQEISGEAISTLIPGVENQGGFRPSGPGEDKNFVVLCTSGEDKDWPDSLDLYTGKFMYYGDNKRPGNKLHETGRGGNRILRHAFDLLHDEPAQRRRICPFLIFQKYPTPVSARSFQFRGLAVPGFMDLPPVADLVAVWKTSNGQRFQNYRAVFTILDVPKISRLWIEDLRTGDSLSTHAPPAWREFVETGKYRPLIAESTTVIRNQEMQHPDSHIKVSILETVWEHFKDAPQEFERFAARLFQMHDQRVIIDEVTRASVDGGRDAFGRYQIGINSDPIFVEFSLEAKCYRPGLKDQKAVSVGVREVSRLISRIRTRQFGVLVTTSFVGRQAYKEVREDRHPIIFISGRDITEILIRNGCSTPEMVKALLDSEFGIQGV